MSAMVSTKPRTLQQRASDANKRLSSALGLDDSKVLAAALAEVAADEVVLNHGLANQVRERYHELTAIQAARPRQPRMRVAEEPELIPLPGVERVRYDPFAKLDPYYLQRVYGNHQLRTALTGYSLAKLKEALALVEQHNPGTKPKNRGRIDDVIDYIVAHVAGEGY